MPDDATFAEKSQEGEESQEESQTPASIPVHCNATEPSSTHPKEYRDASDTEYVLHSVLVHSGGSFGGHYYAYVRPLLGPQWVRFNDALVGDVQSQEAMKANFGQQESVAVSTTAYMLVYIRKNQVHELMFEMTDDMKPHHLQDRFEREKMLAEVDRKRSEEARKSVLVKIWTTDTVATWNKSHPNTVWNQEDYAWALELSKEAPLQELLFQVNGSLGPDPNPIRNVERAGIPQSYLGTTP